MGLLYDVSLILAVEVIKKIYSKCEWSTKKKYDPNMILMSNIKQILKNNCC